MIAALDTLGTMRDGLEDERDQRVQTQLRAIIGTLTNVLQALGFSQFEVEVGEPLDPARMESLGYAAGERGIVLGAVRAGYRADDAVVRPAGVPSPTPRTEGHRKEARIRAVRARGDWDQAQGYRDRPRHDVSAVAAFDTDSGEAEVIVDRREGDAATTPSVVGYERTSGKAIVGAAAKRNLPNDPQNTITEIKREMGEVVKDERGEDQPLTVRFADDGDLPQEISAFTLMKMKEIAEAEIGEEIRDAVITVPAWFPEPQRGATKQAALLAGLYPRQLVPEPTAAAICYGVDKDDPSPHAYLVYDLGGGTFDVSIIKVEGEEINVIATAGDKRLGGGDFDNSIADWAVAQLREQHGLDVSRRLGPGAHQVPRRAGQDQARRSSGPSSSPKSGRAIPPCSSSPARSS